MDTLVIKGIFLRYILLPLIVIILAVVLGYMKKQTPLLKNGVLIVYILLGSLCLAVPGFLGFAGNLFNPHWYLLAMLIYLLLGVLHVNLLNSYFDQKDKPMWFMLFFESLITLMVMLLGGYLFFLVFDWISPFEGYALMATTSIVIFIVPLSFYYCYIQYLNIPFEIHKTWSHATINANVDFEKIDFKTLLLLNLELTKTVVDGKRVRIDAKSPEEGVSIGDWFYRVVDDYNYKYPNSTIHFTDLEGEPYSWIFYTKKSFFHFRRFIDFEQTMRENRITQHTTIICKRVINNEIENKNTASKI